MSSGLSVSSPGTTSPRVAVDLLHAGDWSAEVGTAAQHGDPVGMALELLLARQEFGAVGILPEGRLLH